MTSEPLFFGTLTAGITLAAVGLYFIRKHLRYTNDTIDPSHLDDPND